MKVRTKLILLLLLLSAIFAAGRYFFQLFENKRMLILLEGDMKDKSFTFDGLMKLKGVSLETLAYDYTYWDEMVTFMQKGDLAWAEANLDEETLKTYQADAIWVYKTDLSQIHFVQSANVASLKELPAPIDAVKDILLKKRFCHFFVNTQAGLMEIRGSTIHPTLDAERVTPPQGYFFCGRLWSKEYIGEFEQLMEGVITINATKQATPDLKTLLKTNTVIFSKELPGLDGKPLAYLYTRIEPKELDSYERFSRYTAVIFIAFLVSVLIFITVSLTVLVNMPLDAISRALKTADPRGLRGLEKNTSEFGDIARLISEFFLQKEELVKEVNDRKSAEERFRQVADAAQEWIWEVDKNGLYVYSSPVVERILGYKPEEIVFKKHFYDFFTPETREDLKKKVFELFTGKNTFKNLLNVNLSRNGNVVFLETSGVPILGQDGNLIGYRGADKDVTARKKAEEEITREKENAQKYIDIAGVVMIIIDAQGKVSLINKKGCELLGYKKEEIIGKDWCDNFIPEDEKDKVRDLSDRMLKGEIEVNEYFENHVLTKNGKSLISWCGIILRDDKGAITGHLSSGEDITERKKAEEQQRLLLKDLEDMNKIMVGRELKMVELKNEINGLNQELGRPAPYKDASLNQTD
ncbi:MAG: PAS domain S-box protein [Candidatus Omnitrophica bacterium]|nr:PAS domain S-box protein [Candidatus Omnitrophota bacterium]